MADRYKMYFSKSSMMNQCVFSGGFKGFKYRRNFIDQTYNTFRAEKGINNVLLVYFDMYYKPNTQYAYHRVYFSIDGEVMEIKNMDPLYEGEPFYIESIKTGKKIEKDMHLRALNFILTDIIQYDIFKIQRERMQYKSIALVQVDFEDHIIKPDKVTQMLRVLFDDYFGILN